VRRVGPLSVGIVAPRARGGPLGTRPRPGHVGAGLAVQTARDQA
jgi:hypothetical protein